MRRKKTEQAKLQEDVKEWEYEFDFFEEYAERAKYNEFQAEYYEWLAEEWGDDSFERRARVTRDCSKTWTIDFYKKNHLKQVVRVDRCKDPFCYNCQALRAQRRFETYAPILAKYEDDYDVYHIVLSVPNVSGAKLPGTVEWMLDRFGRVIEYFNGDKKIKGFDFDRFGYIGAVRALEITTGKRAKIDGDDFHPHLHCMFILRKGMNFVHDQYNSFSDDKVHSNSRYFFSAFEILLQRIWCLLMLRIKVTMENVRNIWQVTDGLYKDGFSVRAYPANRRWKDGIWQDVQGHGKYHELFKYAIKGTYKNESIFTREQFVAMYKAIHKCHVYQTYGVLRQYDFDKVDDDELSATAKTEIKFDLFLQALHKSEKPFRTETDLDSVLLDFKANSKRKKKIRYFGLATFRRMLAGKSEEELQTLLDEWIKELV